MNSIITPTPTDPADRLSLADNRIEIFPATSLVEVDGSPVKWASPQRMRVLIELAAARDTYLSSDELALRMYGDNVPYMDPNNPQVHLSKIRQCLGYELGDPQNGAIRTRIGVGYCAVSSLNSPTPPIVDKNGAIHEIADARLIVNEQTQTVLADEKALDSITVTEFQILATLARSAETPFGLHGLQRIIGKDSIPMLISYLRSKLGPELGHKSEGAVRTKRGVGYYAVRSL